MKTIKIIIGIIVLYGAGTEYISASRELGTLFSPGIIIGILLLLTLATWLIGSGFTSGKFKFKSFDFLKFFIISFVTFGIVAFFSLAAKVTPSHYVNIQGVKIPLGKCIDGSRRIIPDENERETFCKCFIEKIMNEPELKAKYQAKLESNRALDVFQEIQESEMFLKLSLENCMTAVKMKWTDTFVEGMKSTWKDQLLGTEFENTNDIDKYCDCLATEYRNYPIETILEDDFAESAEAREIADKCTEISLK